MKERTKEILSKEVNILERSVPLALILIVALAGTGAAAVLATYGTVTGTADVDQAVTVDDSTSFNFDDQQAGETVVAKRTLNSQADVDTTVGFSSTCDKGDDDNDVLSQDTNPVDWTGDCYGIDTRYVEYFDDAGADGADLSGYDFNTSRCQATVSDASAVETELQDHAIVCVDGDLSSNLEIDEDGVTVASVDGPGATTIDISGSTRAVTITGDDVTFTGFEVTGVTDTSPAVKVVPSGSTWLTGAEVSYLEVHTNKVKGLMLTGGVQNSVVRHVEAHDNTLNQGDNEGPSDSESDGIGLWRVNDTNVTHVTAYKNGDNGVYFNGENNRGEDIVAYENGDQGIDVSADYGMTGGTTLVGIKSYGNDAPGIEVEDNEKKVKVTHAVVRDNGQAGDDYARSVLVSESNYDDDTNADVVVSQSILHGPLENAGSSSAYGALVATDNFFPNGIDTRGDGDVNADWQTKTDLTIEAGASDKFGIVNEFAINLKPADYGLESKVVPTGETAEETES